MSIEGTHVIVHTGPDPTPSSPDAPTPQSPDADGTASGPEGGDPTPTEPTTTPPPKDEDKPVDTGNPEDADMGDDDEVETAQADNGVDDARIETRSEAAQGGEPHPDVNVQLPRQGEGYIPVSSPDRQYGKEETIEFLKNMGKSWKEKHDKPRLQIGDISKKGGGPLSPHKSHQKGVDVDIQIIAKGGKEQPKRTVSIHDDDYSKELTQGLVDLIRQVAGADLVFILSADTSLAGVKEEKGHIFHVHVRLKE